MCAWTLGAGSAWGQGFLMRFEFSEGAAATHTFNAAPFPVGSNPAPLVGAASLAGTGGCGSAGALFGGGLGFNYVDTGWATQLPASWSLGFYLDATLTGGQGSGFQYCCGDVGAGNWRIFTNGAAGAGNAAMRGPFNEVVIPGGGNASQAVHLLWTHDHVLGETRGYLDGVLSAVVAQPGGASLTSTSTSPPHFTVGGLGGSPSSLLVGVFLDRFVLANAALSVHEVQLEVRGCRPAQWQVNQPGQASLVIGGQVGTPQAPATTSVCVGEVLVYQSDGIAGLPWDLAAGALPGVPLGSGAFTTPGGQIVNQDLTDPGLVLLNGLMGTSLYPGAFGAGVIISAGAGTLSATQFNASPGHPSGDGVALSQFCRVLVQSGSTFMGPAMDDGILEIPAAACGGPSTGMFTFAGTQHARAFVSSNGNVSFGAGDPSYQPTLPSFAGGPPRLAGCWTDLAPQSGGSITTTLALGTLSTTFLSVPTLGAPNTLNSVSLGLDALGVATISNYTPGANPVWDTLVGLSPGGGAFDPGPVGGVAGGTFQSLAGSGLHTGMPFSMVYQLVLGGAPAPGFASIVFMPDGRLWQVH